MRQTSGQVDSQSDGSRAMRAEKWVQKRTERRTKGEKETGWERERERDKTGVTAVLLYLAVGSGR